MPRKSNKSKKNKLKKGKVHIPAIKIIFLCVAIIAVCMVLLFVTAKIPENKNPAENTSVAERFVQKSDSKTKNSKTETPQKNADSKKSEKTSEIKKNNSEKSGTGEVKKSQKSDFEKQKTQKPAPETKNNSKTSTENSKKEQKSEAVTEKKSQNQVQKTENSTENKKTTPAVKENQKSENSEKTASYNFPSAVNGAQLVFLFDDGGQNLNQLQKFLELPFPITVAVLPRLAHSAESAKAVRAAGKELMLHQPMQAVNSSVNPGPGAIKPEMSEDEIKNTLFYNINELAPIAGLNNHEGSAITADAEKMEIILKVAESQGIYFLDSRTNVNTQVPYVCHELGYSYYERNGNFLDNEKTKENALKELRKNLDIANKNGVVIMIGHIWSANFLPEFLNEVYPELKSKGYTFTTVSKCKGRKF